MYGPLRFLVLAMVFAGCASGDLDGRGFSPSMKSAKVMDRHGEAVAAYEAGDYARALVVIENTLDRIGPSAEREELVFIRADAHHQLRNFHDAEQAYGQYLREYPEGRYRAIVTQGRLRIPAERAEPQAAAAERLEAARRDLEALRALERDFPRDPQIKYLIGNLHYEMEDYDRAGRYYFEAQAIEAAYKEKDLIRQRLFIDEEGEPRAMTPSALGEYERQLRPLVVFDVYPYRQRSTDSLEPRLVYANVSGKVRNQGTETLHDVVLEVRFLNALGNVLDIETIAVGTVPPGGVRAFLASANRYDNLFNITQIEVIPRSGE
jgi:tetratricopeptide (TPR) repeat protein